MKQEGAQDRLIMLGLVALGLLTVAAGILSGRSTIDYVLGRDARQAALTWAADLDARLRQPDTPQRVLDAPLEVLNVAAFQQLVR